MKNEFITMEEILERLKEWKENTDIDIKSDWIEPDTRQNYIRQTITLAQCIGMLETIGVNGNFKTN